MTREELQALVRARRSEFYGDNPLYACPTCGGGRRVLVATADGAREVACPQCGTMPGDGR